MAKGPWKRLGSRQTTLQQWEPPNGWVEQGPCLWVPPNYKASAWELAQPAIATPEDAEVEYFRCASSLAYFAFRHVWTVDVDDPWGAPQFRKFPCYPYLRRFFQTVQPLRNYHVEKSRQMTLSWAWMVVFLWDVLFHENWPNLVVSRRSSEVDDGGASSTPDSLLGKVRFMHGHLPVYLQHAFEIKSHSIRCPSNRSYIKGETGTGHAGRGPTYRRALMDEAAYIEGSEGVFKAVRSTAKRGTVLNSTPNGKGNAFARVRFNPSSSFVKLRFHWTEHPRKAEQLACSCGWHSLATGAGAPPALQFHEHDCANRRQNPPRQSEALSPWYEEQCADLTPEGVASELDIGYEKSRRGRVYDAFDSTFDTFDHTTLIDPKTGVAVGEKKSWESLLDYRQRYLRAALKPNRTTFTAWDFGVGDPTAILLGQIDDEDTMEVRWIDEYEANGLSWDHYHSFVKGLWLPAWEAVNGGIMDMVHYGDPAGKQRDSQLMSWISNLATGDPPIFLRSRIPNGSRLEWIDFVRRLYRERRVKVSTWCAGGLGSKDAPGLIDAVEQWHWPVDGNGEPTPGEHMPVHDKFSHKATAQLYFYCIHFNHRLPVRDQSRSVSLADLLSMGDSDLSTPASF